MQLTVRALPYYKNGLKGTYPAVARELIRSGSSWKAEEPSLLDIVAEFDRFLYESVGNPSVREILLEHRTKLRSLHEKIQTHIADWNLAEADKILYQIEDIFDDIERELDDM